MSKSKNELVNVVEEILGNFYKLEGEPEDSITVQARRYVDMHELAGFLEIQMKAVKPLLVEAKVDAIYPDLDLKLTYVEGTTKTEIDPNALFFDLAAQNRTPDFVKVASVTQASLKKLPDGEALALKHKVELGQVASTVKVSALSKADWVRIESMKLQG
jgi:hypothetical protein